MVLEDMKGIGYENLPYGRSFDLKHLECVMHLLAKVHANSFELVLASKANGLNFDNEHEYLLEEQYVVPGGKVEAEFEVLSILNYD